MNLLIHVRATHRLTILLCGNYMPPKVRWPGSRFGRDRPGFQFDVPELNNKIIITQKISENDIYNKYAYK